MELQANFDSLGVIIDQLCRDWREVKGAAIGDIPQYVQDAILRRNGFLICLQWEPNFGRYFPSFERQWIGGDGTLKVTCYVNGKEDDLVNNPQHFFEQLGVGVVLAHIPNFIDVHLKPSVTLKNFREDYPQLAGFGDRVCATLKDMVSAE